MEKRPPVDQLDDIKKHRDKVPLDRFDRTRTFILANPHLFATQGSVVATWRVRGGKRFGPYYRLAYRRHGRQCSIYLGPRPVADRLRQFLTQLQRPHRRHQLYKRLQTQVRASLKTAKTHLARQLAPLGITLLMVALPMIGGFGPAPEAPGFRWKPSVHWLCKGQ